MPVSKNDSSFATRGLLFCSLVLSILGLVFVFHASVVESYRDFDTPFHFIRSQLVWWALGWAALGGAWLTPIHFWRRLAPWLFGASLLMLVLVFVPGVGRAANGARRWISLLGVRLQPVETFKLSLILFFATWMERHQKLAPFLFLTVLPCGLLMLQPDLGSALIVLAIAFGVYFISGAPMKRLLGVAGLGLVLVCLLTLLSPYRMRRVTTFLDPESDPLGASFHIRQIILSLGSGGVFGQGFGQSRQLPYIPEASTDSIFAIIGEEVGFVGALVVILFYVGYLFWGMKIVRQQEEKSFESLLSAGIVIWVMAQVLINLGSVVALVPLTGVPLPFISYGGTALVMVLGATGILLRLSMPQVAKSRRRKS